MILEQGIPKVLCSQGSNDFLMLVHYVIKGIPYLNNYKQSRKSVNPGLAAS